MSDTFLYIGTKLQITDPQIASKFKDLREKGNSVMFSLWHCFEHNNQNHVIKEDKQG